MEFELHDMNFKATFRIAVDQKNGCKDSSWVDFLCILSRHSEVVETLSRSLIRFPLRIFPLDKQSAVLNLGPSLSNANYSSVTSKFSYFVNNLFIKRKSPIQSNTSHLSETYSNVTITSTVLQWKVFACLWNVYSCWSAAAGQFG